MTMMTSNGVDATWGSLILHEIHPTGKEIGRGAYGRVFEVDYEGTLCAAKEVYALLLQLSQGDDLQKIKDDFLSECQIWSTLRHPCIVQFLGSVIFQYSSVIFIVMQVFRLFPKVRNPYAYGNISAAILNGAMISSIVW